jgi:hypothetical protein
VAVRKEHLVIPEPNSSLTTRLGAIEMLRIIRYELNATAHSRSHTVVRLPPAEPRRIDMGSIET